MNAPRTEAGRALLDLWIADSEIPQLDYARMVSGIAQVEDEALKPWREALQAVYPRLYGALVPAEVVAQVEHLLDTAQ